MNGQGQNGPAADAVRARQQFVSDVFHSISQPLTALRCSIELALMQDGNAEHYHNALQEALTHADRVTGCAEFLRVMAEAEDPGHPCDTDLYGCVSRTIEEFAPVFEANGRKMEARQGSNVRVRIDPQKLERALFLLFDFCAAEGLDVMLHVEERGQLQVRFGDRQVDGQVNNTRAQQSLDLAKRMLAATGAQIDVACGPARQGFTITWPQAES